jgi:phosphomannomutase
MKPFDYYSKPQTLYPNKKDYITSYVYDKGVVLWSGPTWEKNKAELKEEYPNALIQEVLDEEGYKAHQKQYGEETHKLQDEFRKDLFEEFGVMENPKRNKAFYYAWDKGHSAGYSQVHSVFSEIVELIED